MTIAVECRKIKAETVTNARLICTAERVDTMQFSPWISLAILSSGICFASLGFFLRRFRLLAVSGLTFLLINMGLWGLTISLEAVCVDLETKVWVTRIGYLFYVSLSPCYVLFVKEYRKHRTMRKDPFVLLLFAISALFLALQWLNPGEQFYREVRLLDVNGFKVFKPSYGVLFYVYVIWSTLTLLITGTQLMLVSIKGQVRLTHTLLLLALTFAPLPFAFYYIKGLSLIDLTPVGFILSCGCMFILLRREFFAELPISGRHVMAAMSDGVILLDNRGHVLEANEAARALLSVGDRLDPLAAAQAIVASWPLDRGTGEQRRLIQAFLHPQQGPRFYRVSANVLALRGRGQHGQLLIIQDETALFRAEERLHYLEHFDQATGLANRLHFTRLLEQEVGRCHLMPQGLALVCASIVGFKDYCEVYGTAFGDAMLREVGLLIQGLLRKSDAISRFSADEYYFFLRLEGDGSQIGLQADSAMARLFDLFKQPVTVAGMSLSLRLRAGMAYCPLHSQNVDKLIAMARSAKIHATTLGGKAYHLYNERMGESLERYLRLEQDLHTALLNQELFLLYQPQINLCDHRVIGVEALLRWQHPKLGLISPAEFIPIAEESGLIHSVGLWVLGQALEQLAAWNTLRLCPLRMSVNLSLSQLTNPNLADQVLSLVQHAGIEPGSLELELTESLALFPEALTHGHLAKLQESGIRIAMDDFGMGHSSLTYLKAFTLSTIKIDRALSCDILENPTSVAMIRSVQTMCEALGIDLVVEYVENPEQLKVLEDMGCTLVQGFVFSGPLPVAACEQYIRRANQAQTHSANRVG